MPANDRRRDRIRRRLAGEAAAAALAGGLCLFGLSNRPADMVARMGMATLRPVPARLADCDHRYYRTGRSGRDQIDCAFLYRVAGRTYRGEAESLTYRPFTSKATLDAEVSRLRTANIVTAYVDPRRPVYAWAFIDDALFLPATWGVFEADLGVLAVLFAAIIAGCVVRWRRAA